VIKNGARIFEEFLGPKLMVPKILGSAEISTVMSAMFEILVLWVKIFSKINHLQKCQKTSFY
jgi:hypothetical protein